MLTASRVLLGQFPVLCLIADGTDPAWFKSMVAIYPGLAPSRLLQAADPDPARFDRLFVQHYSWVWRTLRRLGVHSSAVDDAAQHVFLTASQRLALVPPDKERAF
ncbi:MAG: hypothetical protein ABIQ16_11385, partial [Polyangiaceae bacterium]